MDLSSIVYVLLLVCGNVHAAVLPAIHIAYMALYTVSHLDNRL